MVEPIKVEGKRVFVLDQRKIPEIKWVEIKNFKEGFDAIKKMVVRGAPLIGIVAFYTLAIECQKRKNIDEILKLISLMSSARPTAVNLQFALSRFEEVVKKFIGDRNFKKVVFKEAIKFHNREILSTEKISKFGTSLFKKPSTVMTYCNAGSLATSGLGTAVGVIRETFRKGKIKEVVVCETRPYLQGLRLTAFELQRDNIPYKIICDNTAGFLMKKRYVDAVIVGADRIALNGDTANKIGTYTLAILAKENKIPFYVAAPTSTFDKNVKNGDLIPIEVRDPSEIMTNIKIGNLPKDNLLYYAFDVTPFNLIRAIITEKGIIHNKDFFKIEEFLK